MDKNYGPAFSVKSLKTASWEGNLATGSLIYPCISQKRNSAQSQSSETFLMGITDNCITQQVKNVMSTMATQDFILAKRKNRRMRWMQEENWEERAICHWSTAIMAGRDEGLHWTWKWCLKAGKMEGSNGKNREKPTKIDMNLVSENLKGEWFLKNVQSCSKRKGTATLPP